MWVCVSVCMCKMTLEQVLHSLSIIMPFVTTENIIFGLNPTFYSSFKLFCLHDNDMFKRFLSSAIF